IRKMWSRLDDKFYVLLDHSNRRYFLFFEMFILQVFLRVFGQAIISLSTIGYIYVTEVTKIAIDKGRLMMGKKNRNRVNAPKKNNHIPEEAIIAEQEAHGEEFSPKKRKNGPGSNNAYTD
ncbi:hypothetical protein ACFWDG_07580, partial [Peribacillus sp. NPDC060186]